MIFDVGHWLNEFERIGIKRMGGQVYDMPKDRHGGSGSIVCIPDGVLSDNLEPLADWEVELIKPPVSLFTYSYADNKWDLYSVIGSGGRLVSTFFTGERMS